MPPTPATCPGSGSAAPRGGAALEAKPVAGAVAVARAGLAADRDGRGAAAADPGWRGGRLSRGRCRCCPAGRARGRPCCPCRRRRSGAGSSLPVSLPLRALTGVPARRGVGFRRRSRLAARRAARRAAAGRAGPTCRRRRCPRPLCVAVPVGRGGADRPPAARCRPGSSFRPARWRSACGAAREEHDGDRAEDGKRRQRAGCKCSRLVLKRVEGGHVYVFGSVRPRLERSLRPESNFRPDVWRKA